MKVKVCGLTRIINSAGKIAPGIDVRGERGYVIAAGRTETGRYRWIEGRTPEDLEPANAPGWLIMAATAKPKPAKIPPGKSTPGKIIEGQRNMTLFRMLCADRAKGGDDEKIERLAREYNETRCESPLDEDEIAKTVAQVCRYPVGVAAIPVVAGQIDKVVDATEQAIAGADCQIYQRGGTLCEVLRLAERSGDEHGVERPAGSLRIRLLTTTRLVDLLTREVCFVKYDGRAKEWRAIDCPIKVAEILLSRGTWPLPELLAIVETPTLRTDGSLLDKPGYDEATGLLFDPGPYKFPAIPAELSRDDARAALARLKRPLRKFPFVGEADLSVALAAMLTGLVRSSLRSAPLFAFSAPTMATGKSLLASLVGLLATGREPARMSQAWDGAEDQKVLLSTLIAGDRLVLLDNIDRELKSAAFASILTEPKFKGRLLGRNEIYEAPTNVTFLATGNNISIVADLSTRVLICEIDAGAEHPEQRRFKFDPRKAILRRRPQLVADALTVMLAYQAAGCPELEIKPFGRFEQWSGMVRSALVWAGETDPCDSRSRVEREDSDRQGLLSFLMAAEPLMRGKARTVRGLINLAEDDPRGEALKTALKEIAGDDLGKISSTKLGYYLKRHKNRVVGGLRLEQREEKTRQGTTQWRITKPGEKQKNPVLESLFEQKPTIH